MAASDAMIALREALHAERRRTTSTRDPRGTRKLISASIAEKSVRDRFLACSNRKPCSLSFCPRCAKSKGNRYFNQVLRRHGVDQLPASELRFITLNCFIADDLIAGARLMASREHDALQHIVQKFHTECVFLNATNGQPLPGQGQIRLWGAREVEPLYDPATGRVQWKYHMHMIVHMDGLDDQRLAAALRARWPAAHAVRVDQIRGKNTKKLEMSLRRICRYSAKANMTYRRQDRKREWLPPDVIDALVRWMEARSKRWQMFSLGCR